MRMHNLLRRESVFMAAAMSCTLIAVAADPTRSNAADMNVMAVSGIVTGNVQEVGFRAMIQKQAIQYNLAGSAENDNDILMSRSARSSTFRFETGSQSEPEVAYEPISSQNSLITGKRTRISWKTAIRR